MSLISIPSWALPNYSLYFEQPVIFKNLTRLFSADDYSMNRLSVGDESANADVSQYMADPWRVIVDAASEDTAGLERCLQWVLVLARSGVEIPNNTLMQLSAFARDFNAPFITHSILAEVILFSVWVKSFGRNELLALISSLYTRQSNWLKEGMANKEHLELVYVRFWYDCILKNDALNMPQSRISSSHSRCVPTSLRLQERNSAGPQPLRSITAYYIATKV